MTVRDELTSCGAGLSDAEAVDDVVQAALEELQEDFTRHTLGALSLLEEVAELTLEYAIGVLSLLLFLELDAIFARLTTAVVAVLSRRIVLLGEYLVGTEDRCAKLTGDL